MSDPVEALTAGQRDCLRLVFGHMTSKDIARALGISPHTVDMRLRTAMRTLGVASRIEAARLLVAAEGEPAAYQPLIYQASELSGAADAGEEAAPVPAMSDDHAEQHSETWTGPEAEPPAGGPPRSAGDLRTGEGRSNGGPTATPLAQSLPWGRENRLTPGARLAWIATIAIGSAIAFGAILAALEALKKLL